jgi:hypothetical protein
MINTGFRCRVVAGMLAAVGGVSCATEPDAVGFAPFAERLPTGTSGSDLLFRGGFDFATWRVLKSSSNTLLVFPCGGGSCVPQSGLIGDIPQPSDFDGDAKADIATWRSSDATWRILRSSDVVTMNYVRGQTGDVPVGSDYDGEGKADRAIWRPVDGTWHILRSYTGSELTFPCAAGLCVPQYGVSGDLPVPADYEYDAKADFALWRPSDAHWRITLSSSLATVDTAWGIPGDIPVPSDYDGDHKADRAVWRPADGMWHVWKSSTGAELALACPTGFCVPQVGLDGDFPQPRDFDGDGKADFAVWRPSDGTWRILLSSNNVLQIRIWGSLGDVPVAADYDGDGKADVAVLR